MLRRVSQTAAAVHAQGFSQMGGATDYPRLADRFILRNHVAAGEMVTEVSAEAAQSNQGHGQTLSRAARHAGAWR
jgi:hypothetical protein